MVTLAYLLIAIGALISLAGGIILILAAFRVSVGWGLAVLLLSWLVIPLIIFLVKHWRQARVGFLLWIAGFAISAVGGFVLMGFLATTTLAELRGFEPSPTGGQSTSEPPVPDVEAADRQVPAPEPDPLGAAKVPTLAPAVEETLAEIGQPEADEEPTATPAEQQPAEVVTLQYDELEPYVGQAIGVRLKDGSEMVAFLDEVGTSAIQVTQRMGGGAVSFSIPRDAIVEIRLP